MRLRRVVYLALLAAALGGAGARAASTETVTEVPAEAGEEKAAGAAETEQPRKTESRFRRKMRRDVAALKKDLGFRYVEVEELMVDPQMYADSAVSTIGILQFYDLGAQTFRVGNAFGVSGALPVCASKLDKEGRKTLLKVSFPPHVLAVKGRLRRKAPGAPAKLTCENSFKEELFLEAETFSDLGRFPEGVFTVNK